MKNMILAGRTASVIFHANSHFHNAWEFIYYTNGSGYLRHGNSISAFTVGDIAIVPPHIPHYEETISGYENFIIMFSHSEEDPHSVRFHHDNEGCIRPIVEMMYSQFFTEHPNWRNICEAGLSLIEQYLISYDIKRVGCTCSPIVSSFVNILITQFSSPSFQLQDVMKDFPYSESYLRKVFKREMGKSPAKYLNHLRIKFARRLLEESTLSVKGIAYMSGFSDPYYFSRQFKMSYGKSPKEWRNDADEAYKAKDEQPVEILEGLPRRKYADLTVWTK